jgi:hypothetical protein
MQAVEALPPRPTMASDSIAAAREHELANHGHETAKHLRREALTMGLYVSITLLAALSATAEETTSKRDVLAIVWGTTVGLALAHWLAFGLAVRLVHPTSDNADLDQQLFAQMTAAATVAFIATVPVLFLPEHLGRPGARFAAAGVIGVVTYGEARSFGAPRTKAVRLAAVALVLALLVAGIKYGLGH